MSQEQECLFELLGNSLWGCSVGEIPPDIIERVLGLAEEQTVFAQAFDVISKLDIIFKQDRVLESIGMVQTIQQQNQVLEKVLADFVSSIEKQGVEYLVVKGQTVAQLYPNPELRMSGDIDYLIKDNYRQVKTKIEKALKVELPLKMVEKEVAYLWKDVVFELHTNLIDFSCKKHQKYWDKLILDEWGQEYFVEIEGEKVYTLSPTLNAVYLFLHIFTHFMRAGVSLRQFCDWAVLIKHHEKTIDREKVEEILKNLGMKRAYGALGTILVDKMGLPENTFPMRIDESHREWTSKILYDIFRGGNFGRMNHRAKHSWLFKIESFGLAIRNTIRYYWLSPAEMRMMIPKMVGINIKLINRY